MSNARRVTAAGESDMVSRVAEGSDAVVEFALRQTSVWRSANQRYVSYLPGWGGSPDPPRPPAGGGAVEPSRPPAGGGAVDPSRPPAGGGAVDPSRPPAGGGAVEPSRPPAGGGAVDLTPTGGWWCGRALTATSRWRRRGSFTPTSRRWCCGTLAAFCGVVPSSIIRHRSLPLRVMNQVGANTITRRRAPPAVRGASSPAKSASVPRRLRLEA